MLAMPDPIPNFNQCIKKYFPQQKIPRQCHFMKVTTLINPDKRTIKNKVTVVRSAPSSNDYRHFIRQTWGSTLQNDIPVIFVLGTTPEIDVRSEAAIYHDILQFDFNDSYYNLTLKMVSIYNYFLKEYPSVDNIIVLNDDTIVNSTAIKMVTFCFI